MGTVTKFYVLVSTLKSYYPKKYHQVLCFVSTCKLLLKNITYKVQEICTSCALYKI